MGFLDWIKGVGQSVWQGLKSFGRGVGAWGQGLWGGITGSPVGDPNSDDVYERLKAAGGATVAGLKNFIPAAVQGIKEQNIGKVLTSGIDSIKMADRLSRYRSQEG